MSVLSIASPSASALVPQSGPPPAVISSVTRRIPAWGDRLVAPLELLGERLERDATLASRDQPRPETAA